MVALLVGYMVAMLVIRNKRIFSLFRPGGNPGANGWFL
jgi:hypothetical protein